jgi:hypothetical protein
MVSVWKRWMLIVEIMCETRRGIHLMLYIYLSHLAYWKYLHCMLVCLALAVTLDLVLTYLVHELAEK